MLQPSLFHGSTTPDPPPARTPSPRSARHQTSPYLVDVLRSPEPPRRALFEVDGRALSVTVDGGTATFDLAGLNGGKGDTLVLNLAVMAAVNDLIHASPSNENAPLENWLPTFSDEN